MEKQSFHGKNPILIKKLERIICHTDMERMADYITCARGMAHG